MCFLGYLLFFCFGLGWLSCLEARAERGNLQLMGPADEAVYRVWITLSLWSWSRIWVLELS